MRRLSAALLLVTAPLVLGCGQGPRIRLSAASWDFGSPLQGATGETDVRIENEGDQPLVLGKIEVTCGCVKASVDRTEIEPGGSATMHLVLDTSRVRGAVKKHILIRSNDPERPEIRFEVKGTIVPIVWLETTDIDLGKLPAGKIHERKFEIFVRKGHEVKLERIVCNPPLFEIDTEPVAREDGTSGWVATLRLPATTPPRRIFSMCSVYTDFSKVPQMTLRVRGEIIGAVAVSPKRIPLGRIQLGGSTKRRLTVTSGNGQNIVGLKAVCDDPAIGLEVVERVPGQYYWVHVTYTAQSPGDHRGVVRITAKQPAASVDVPWAVRVSKGS